MYSYTKTVTAGAYTNYATVTAVNNKTGVTVKDDDPANIFGAVTKINVEKAINAVDPLQPTPAEDADDPADPLRLIWIRRWSGPI